MNSIRTTIKNRRIEVSAPPELPDGTEVFIQLVPMDQKDVFSETDWDTMPERIEACSIGTTRSNLLSSQKWNSTGSGDWHHGSIVDGLTTVLG